MGRQLRVRSTYVDYRNAELEAVFVKNATLGAMTMIEAYGVAIERVLDGELKVKAAIAKFNDFPHAWSDFLSVDKRSSWESH